MIWLVLPDAWRIELMRRPSERDAWLRALTEQPSLRLIDWAARKPTAGDTLFVARLDLAAAELVLKLPNDVRTIAIESSWSFPLGAAARFLSVARARLTKRVELPTVGHTLPPFPKPFLAAVVRLAEGLS